MIANRADIAIAHRTRTFRLARQGVPNLIGHWRAMRADVRRKRLAQDMALCAGENWHDLTPDQQSQWARQVDAYRNRNTIASTISR